MKPSIKMKIQKHLDKIKKADEAILKLVKDEPIVIISGYNGQVCGSSKKALTGKQFNIGGVSTDMGECQFSLIDGPLVYIGMQEVEFLN